MSNNQIPDFKIIIPARYASTRFPGKPLVDIAGKTMLQHAWECARKSAASEIIIATDDDRIYQVAKQFGAKVCMTDNKHPTGTDRLGEVCGLYQWSDDDIVVNLQGDEPLTPAVILQQVAHNLSRHARAGMATLSTPILSAADVSNPNVVKVVTDKEGYALYFSRAPIPWNRDTPNVMDDQLVYAYQRHLGIYAYRVGFLRSYSTLKPCELERIEKLEQLRALYNGVAIHVAVAQALPGPGIDSPEDLVKIRDLLAG
ncbi:MAG TPA: 3-deoxy-manno-octulosonate cytidylyltransferase [Gammaproteobacteria bacterium]|nr:3-deoxy-manno-octulosonate cytidylyltransferase [Gammaproteobacteria bacterium]